MSIVLRMRARTAANATTGDDAGDNASRSENAESPESHRIASARRPTDWSALETKIDALVNMGRELRHATHHLVKKAERLFEDLVGERFTDR